MTSKNLLKTIFFYFLIFEISLAGNIEFKSDNIKVFEKGKIIHAFKGKAIDIEKKNRN